MFLLCPNPGASPLSSVGALVVAVLVSGCEEPPRPWAARPSKSVIDESQPFLPSSADDGWLGDAGFEDLPDDAGSDPAPPASGETPPPQASRVGGLWASCAQGFATTGDPERDVTRLGLICGPINGMRQLGGTVAGTLGPDRPAEHHIEALRGGCYRVFAAAAGLNDLGVEVVGPTGTRVAGTDPPAGWAAVDRERPFCTFDAANLTIRLTSEDGGRYALQVWQLPPSKSR